MTEINEKTLLNRRDFLTASATVLGGLVVAFNMPSAIKGAMAAEAAAKPIGAPNAFIHIAPDNTITMVINKLEMGQGVNTSMAQLIAEELECDWTSIRSVSAPVNPVYNHTVFGMQMTGGSSALASSWDQHRKIGASMREMLKQAAANRWKIPVAMVKAENGFLTNSMNKEKLSYGDVATEANALPLPKDPPLKNAKDFKIIGKSMKRVDALEKSNGKAIYGMDVRIPGMLYAVVARSHIDGGEISSFNDKAARSVSGVVDVIKMDNHKIAVVAMNTYAANKGRDALDVRFKSNAHDKASTDEWMQEFKKQSAGKGIVAKEKGNVDEALKSAHKTYTYDYEFPFLAHASMEPLNCTVDFDGKKADIWSGHQMPTVDQGTAAKVLGLKPEQVNVHTTYAGGSFGRRANKNSDYVVIACELAKIIKKPVKYVMMREDDTRAGFYRPMNFHRVKLGVDNKGKLLGWHHHIVGQSVIGNSVFESMMVKNGLESTITEGISDTHYNIPAFRCEQTRATTPLTTLWYRSVGHTHTAFVMETMIDEVAHLEKTDPLKFRQSMLKSSPRHMAVLELLKKQTGWGTKKAPAGRAWGLAVHESFNTVVGQVAEVSIVNGMPHVHKVWCAVHCGQVVNPEVAKTQIEGGIVFGITSVLHHEIAVRNGQVIQGNFLEMPVVRMHDMPVVYTEFVKTTDAPTGLGEPGVPPIAPAIANAVFLLNQKRVRVLPFSKGMKV